MIGYLALLVVLSIPAFLSYLIALFAHKKLVKAGNSRPRRMRIIVFILSYVVLLAAEWAWIVTSLSFDR